MEEIDKPVIATTRASRDLNKIESFYSELYGRVRAIEIIDKLVARMDRLKKPIFRKDPVDENFSHLKHEYRKMLDNHIKVTYRIGTTTIYIVRVFDTRQDPKRNL
ncbi:MAG TPA: type II toxin-antitoxin system RelE/ParE family toxin [Flavobacteriaceae bacterium]|nr:type II toxin-antitoxin system RelE/ParE family toxin [Flavobacteriaceae bacterium]